MSKLHEMKLKKQKEGYERKYGKTAGDIDFSKNPLDDFERQLKKRYMREGYK